MHRFLTSLAIFTSFLQIETLFSTTATWSGASNANWNDNTNWSPATFPNGVDDVANLTNAAPTRTTITLNGVTITLGTLNLDLGSGYTINGPGNFNFQTSAGNAAITVTTVNGNGAHTIAAPITLTSPLVITNGSTGALTLSGKISGSQGLTATTTALGGVIALTNATNDFSGGVTIGSSANVTTLKITSDGALGASSAGISNPTQVANFGTLLQLGATISMSRSITGTGAGNHSFGIDTNGFDLHYSGTANFTSSASVLRFSKRGGAGTLFFTGTLTGGGQTQAFNVVTGSIFNINQGFFGSPVTILSGTGTWQLSASVSTGVNNIISNGATIDTNGFNLTVSTENGGNGFTKLGAGTLTVSNSAGSGMQGFTLNAGTANINAAGILGQFGGVISVTGTSTFQAGASFALACPMTLSSGVTFTIDTNTFNFSNSSVIGAAGALAKIGTGTLTLTGVNTYPYGTTLSAGTLNINADAALGAAGTAISVTGSSTLQLAAAIPGMARPISVSSGQTLTLDTNTFNLSNSGALSGSGPINKISAGNFTLSAASPGYTGTITVTTGSLFLTGSGTIPNASVALSGTSFDISGGVGTQTIQDLSVTNSSSTVNLGATHLTFGTSNSTLIGGAITGAGGAVTKTGTGTVSFNGANNYSGTTLVQQGQLNINGSITSNTTINSGATVAGVGQIAGNVLVSGGTLAGTETITGTVTVNSGTIRPGNSIGTLTIVGSLTLDSGSTTTIEISPTANSLISVSGIPGTASIAGTLNLILDPGIPSSSPYTILTASSVSGTFTLQQPTGFVFSVSYTPTSVILQLESINQVVSTLGAGLKGNALATANYINLLANEASLHSAFSPLSMLTGDALSAALDSICPSRNSFTTFVSEETGLMYSKLISSRLSNQRQIRKFRKEKHTEISKYVGMVDENQLFASADDKLPRGSAQTAARKENSFAVWTQGVGEHLHQEAQEQNPAFDATIWGGIAGFDYYGIDTIVVGGAFGYAKDKIHDAHNQGKGDIDFYILSAYVTGYFGNAYAEATLSGGYNQFTNERHVFYTGYDQTSKSHHHGWQLVEHVAIGYDWSVPYFIFEPYFALDVVTNYENAFKEHGSGVLNMRQRQLSSSILQTLLGVNIYESVEGAWGVLIFKESFSYAYQKLITVGRIDAAIVGMPGGFFVNSFEEPKNLFNPAAEIFYKAPNDLFFSISYDEPIQLNS